MDITMLEDIVKAYRMQRDATPLCRKAVVGEIAEHAIGACSTKHNGIFHRAYSLDAPIHLHLHLIAHEKACTRFKIERGPLFDA